MADNLNTHLDQKPMSESMTSTGPMDFIVTRAPLRISFAGGGTDLPSFYQRDHGAVLSATINKYVYVIINQSRPLLDQGVDDPVRYRIRLSYATTENVQRPAQLQHPIVREALKLLDLDIPMDIATMADVPAGTGLGSSGTFGVTLLHGLHLVKGEEVSPQQLASEAAHIEIEILGRPVGKQDHYAAAFGGLNLIRFLSDGNVSVTPAASTDMIKNSLFPSLLLFYTGKSRDAAAVLQEQQRNVDSLANDLEYMRDQAYQLQTLLEDRFSPRDLGDSLHRSWVLKRNLASGITNNNINYWYDRAIQAGAVGGKISGAGGGGFLLLVVEPDSRAEVREALSELPELSIGYESRGSQVMLPNDQAGIP